MLTQGQDLGEFGMYRWEVGMGVAIAHFNMRVRYRQVFSLHFGFLISAALKQIFCPLGGLCEALDRVMFQLFER